MGGDETPAPRCCGRERKTCRHARAQVSMVACNSLWVRRPLCVPSHRPLVSGLPCAWRHTGLAGSSGDAQGVRTDHTGCQDSRSPRFPGQAQGVDFSPELCQLGPRRVGQALVPLFSIRWCLFQDSAWLQMPGHSSPSQMIVCVHGSSGRSVPLLLVESADKDTSGVEGRLCIWGLAFLQ